VRCEPLHERLGFRLSAPAAWHREQQRVRAHHAETV